MNKLELGASVEIRAVDRIIPRTDSKLGKTGLVVAQDKIMNWYYVSLDDDMMQGVTFLHGAFRPEQLKPIKHTSRLGYKKHKKALWEAQKALLDRIELSEKYYSLYKADSDEPESSKTADMAEALAKPRRRRKLIRRRSTR